MANENVVVLSKLVSPERMAELRGEGVVVNRDGVLHELGLPEPKYGEETVGQLTDDELYVFSELSRLKSELESVGREIVGKNLARAGEVIRSSDANKPLMEVFQDSDLADNVTEDDAKMLFTLQQRVNMLHATLHYHLGERFDAHHWRLGVRSRGRVVKIERRM